MKRKKNVKKDSARMLTLEVSRDGVFYSLQGEGITQGLPAVFLRLQGCNLKCVYCDTPYAWNQNSKRFQGEMKIWTVTKIVEKIQKSWQKSCPNTRVQKRLVITGGEPLLQALSLDPLISCLKGWIVEIETNGTIMPTQFQLSCCQFNCSLKLKASGHSERERLIPSVIRKLVKVHTWFKFVVSDPAGIREIRHEITGKFSIPHDRVIIMPEGKNVKEVQKHARMIVEEVKKQGFRLLTRLHLEIWNGKRRM